MPDASVQPPIDLSHPSLHHDPSTGIKHSYFTYGEGPAVILMHEITGMTDLFLKLAKRIGDAGYRVYLPHFFGPLDDRDIPAGLLYCLRNEFNVLFSHGKSRIISWLLGLCEQADAECGGRGVAVIGLCLTGNIVMSAMVHPCVRLGVMSEPALPFTNKAALGVPQSDIEQTQKRALVYPMLGYRFSSDTKCTHAKFQTMQDTFGKGIRLTEIPTGVGPWNIPDKSHSVLTQCYEKMDDPNHPVQHAIDEILTELRLRLHNFGSSNPSAASAAD
jgi:dienelactone hydrolase